MNFFGFHICADELQTLQIFLNYVPDLDSALAWLRAGWRLLRRA